MSAGRTFTRPCVTSRVRIHLRSNALNLGCEQFCNQVSFLIAYSATPTNVTMESCRGRMIGYSPELLSGCSSMPVAVLIKRLAVNSLSMSTTTILPCLASADRLTTSRSFSQIPASISDSPLTYTPIVASGFDTRYSLKSRYSAR